MKQTETLVVGASIAGLASAACLQKQKIDYTIIEKQGQVAMPWRNHYERLHLHTNKRVSNLPYKKFERSVPRYPSRQQVIEYLEAYQKAFAIKPLFNTEAISIKKEADHWRTETAHETFQSEYIIMATGPFGKPNQVQFTGMESFTGQLMHSSSYKTGKDFTAQKVLVIGFGNSACEIAIDLYEQGAHPAMAVRSPVNIIPRDLLGIPILEISLLMSRLSPRVADAINAPILNLLYGDINKLGLAKMPYGPFEEIEKDGNIPVLDIGIIQQIRKGHVTVYSGIDHIAGNTVFFSDGKNADFDAIIAATGFHQDCASVLEVNKTRFEDLSVCVDKQQYFGKDGLYFCGFWVGPTGQIRETASDSKKIAADIAKKNGLKK